jgi:sugar-specific transcriptional regulator TrmB
MGDLTDLGLANYEADAYRTLLGKGSATAKEISAESDVPMGRIYDVLEKIETRGLVHAQGAGQPEKYAAVEPNVALERLFEEKQREYEARLEQYEAVIGELRDELDPATPVEETFATTAIGPESVTELFVGRLAAADERIVLAASALSHQFNRHHIGPRSVDQLMDALDRNVDISILMRPELVSRLPDSIRDLYTTTLSQADGITVRTSEEIRVTFTIIDMNETCIEVTHPLTAERTLAMIDLKDQQFAASVERAFESHWQQADPLEVDS